MQAAYEKALSYSQERMVFGYPIGDYQLTQVKLARMATYLAIGRQFTYSVGRLMDQGEGDMEASMVKFFTCKTAEWVTREALQIHGGMGYAEEVSVSRYFIDARVLSIFEGAEETLALESDRPFAGGQCQDQGRGGELSHEFLDAIERTGGSRRFGSGESGMGAAAAVRALSG
jgi:alkylation response protein AidB-like acyl-CoA dehydrogenase